MFDAMQWQSLELNAVTYGALISACEKGNQPNVALKIVQSMQRQGTTPNVVTYSALISV